MYSKTKVISSLLLILFLFSFAKVSAHSGRTDSSGGHNCYTGSCAGTYHYHNGGSAYNPPIKTYVAPSCSTPNMDNLKGTPLITEVNCKHNISFTWDKGVGDNQYSIALSKTAGADPGPKADTTTRSKTFEGVSSGKWFINIKGGNSCGWSNTTYWEVDVPQSKVAINRFFANKRADGVTELKFDAKCGTSYSITPEIGTLTQAQVNQGYVTVNPEKETIYTLTLSGNGQTQKSTVTVTLPKPTPIPTPVPTVEPTIYQEDAKDTEESKPTQTQEANNFWNTLFDRSVLSTILRVMILKF